ncbi:MAG: hypothetical protein RLZZ511_249 [Cyanobacteriota bacterium]|jgi:acid phosphatase
MRLKRRQFLGLVSLTGIGAIAASGWRKPQPEPLITPSIAPPERYTRPDQLVLRFAATADVGAGDANQRAIGKAMADWQQRYPYDLVVMAGDNIYDNGEISRIKATFEEPYAELLKRGVKFRACLGNHDIRTDNGTPQVQYPGFNMDDRYYDYVQNNCHFFVLDTNANVNWTKQLTWLEQRLTASPAPVKVVYGHHPIYSSGRYGTDRTLVERLGPIFQKHKVNLYINGHEHNYERTKPIDGTTYLITGHGGAHLRPVNPSNISEFALSRHGFSLIEIYKKAIVIQGIDLNGERFDRGEILLTNA